MQESVSHRVRLRPVAEDDAHFLLLIYSSTRIEEMMALDWSPEQRGTFLRHQFEIQHTCYQKDYPNASFDLILLEEQVAGRLYVDRRDAEIRIVDIALLPEFRGQGIGTNLIQRLFEEAASRSVGLTIHVENENTAALRFYERLGFVNGPSLVSPVYRLMQWQPCSSVSSDSGHPTREGRDT